MTQVTCRAVSFQLASAGPHQDLGERLNNHVAGCLQCQAESARYRKLHRRLASLAGELEPAPAGLAQSVERAIDAQSDRAPRRQVVVAAAAAAGAAAAAAAGIAAMVVWRRTRQAV